MARNWLCCEVQAAKSGGIRLCWLVEFDSNDKWFPFIFGLFLFLFFIFTDSIA